MSSKREFISQRSTSNIQIPERIQSKALSMIIDAPWLCAEYGYPKGYPRHQQLKKKSAATALNTVLASAHIQMT
jgi:hypothetical protein